MRGGLAWLQALAEALLQLQLQAPQLLQLQLTAPRRRDASAQSLAQLRQRCQQQQRY